jgi:hypothetical protein
MQPSAVEELAPHAPAVGDVVTKEIRGRRAQELLARHAVLRQHRVVYLRHTLVREHVVERRLPVRAVVPADGLVQHHEEEPVQGLREEDFEPVIHGGV